MSQIKEHLSEEGKDLLSNFKAFFRWCFFGATAGVVVGLVGALTVIGINYVTSLRQNNNWLVYLMPVAGLICVFLYKLAGHENDPGTNAVIEAVRNKNKIKLITAPLIICATILTHLVGGSAGREGAALQFGGSLGEGIGKVFKFSDKDRTIIIMAGMSAAFSAVFGLPVAAVIFPIEVISVGVMYYSALVPCVVSSLIARQIALLLGVKSEAYVVSFPEHFTWYGLLVIVILSILVGILSSVFCGLMHAVSTFLKQKLPNPFIRVLVGSAVLIVLMLVVGDSYLGIGSESIVRAVEEGEAVPWAFIMKMIFTVITLCIGFKGGEIVPSFFIGATFGALVGSVLGYSPALCAAIGMIAMFCGVTNTPIASLIIACELFSFKNVQFFLIAIAVAYLLSGYTSLYTSQKILYSKTEPTFLGGKKSE